MNFSFCFCFFEKKLTFYENKTDTYGRYQAVFGNEGDTQQRERLGVQTVHPEGSEQR